MGWKDPPTGDNAFPSLILDQVKAEAELSTVDAAFLTEAASHFFIEHFKDFKWKHEGFVNLDFGLVLNIFFPTILLCYTKKWKY